MILAPEVVRARRVPGREYRLVLDELALQQFPPRSRRARRRERQLFGGNDFQNLIALPLKSRDRARAELARLPAPRVQLAFV
jgi:hypothetical protein